MPGGERAGRRCDPQGSRRRRIHQTWPSSPGPTPTCIATGLGSIPPRGPAALLHAPAGRGRRGTRLSAGSPAADRRVPFESLAPLAAPEALARLATALGSRTVSRRSSGLTDALYVRRGSAGRGSGGGARAIGGDRPAAGAPQPAAGLRGAARGGAAGAPPECSPPSRSTSRQDRHGICCPTTSARISGSSSVAARPAGAGGVPPFRGDAAVSRSRSSAAGAGKDRPRPLAARRAPRRGQARGYAGRFATKTTPTRSSAPPPWPDRRRGGAVEGGPARGTCCSRSPRRAGRGLRGPTAPPGRRSCRAPTRRCVNRMRLDLLAPHHASLESDWRCSRAPRRSRPGSLLQEAAKGSLPSPTAGRVAGRYGSRWTSSPPSSRAGRHRILIAEIGPLQRRRPLAFLAECDAERRLRRAVAAGDRSVEREVAALPGSRPGAHRGHGPPEARIAPLPRVHPLKGTSCSGGTARASRSPCRSACAPT